MNILQLEKIKNIADIPVIVLPMFLGILKELKNLKKNGTNMKINTKRCLICKPKNDTLYYHVDKSNGAIWLWCNKCDRGYDLKDYCYKAGISLRDFLKQDFPEFKETTANEVRKIEWPNTFLSLSDPRSTLGVEYIRSRGLTLEGDMYYDTYNNGIVFPYYFQNVFVGAQIRFIQERITEDGDPWKITTLPGTRLGLIIYGYNQETVMPHIKGFIICEGAFNALALQQSLNLLYGNMVRCPWKVVACSGSGASTHQREVFGELKNRGYKIVVAADNDEAGLKMFEKYVQAEAVTHYAFTDTALDWNDELKRLGHIGLAKYLLERIKPVV